MRGKLGHPIWTYTPAKTLDFPRTFFSHQDYAANNHEMHTIGSIFFLFNRQVTNYKPNLLSLPKHFHLETIIYMKVFCMNESLSDAVTNNY
jgi:hypothetical protein